MVPVEDVLWVRYIVVFHDVLAAGESIVFVLQLCYQSFRSHPLHSVFALTRSRQQKEIRSANLLSPFHVRIFRPNHSCMLREVERF